MKQVLQREELEMSKKWNLIAAAIFSVAAGQAVAQSERDYPSTLKADHATPETAKLFYDAFEAKSTGRAEDLMSHFSTDMVGYCDTTLGWPCKTFEPLLAAFKKNMPNWTNGLSYPVEVLGGPESAVVYFVDTPELFGSDLRVVGVVDVRDGKIIRWADYWDGSSYPIDGFNKILMPPEKFNKDYLEGKIDQRASDEIVGISEAFANALSTGSQDKFDALFSYGVVFEDAALRTRIVGEPAVLAYLKRSIEKVPYGKGVSIRHIAGGERGGGFEWTSSGQTGVKIGVAALTLNDAGKIERVTMMYNGRRLSEGTKRELILLSADEL